MSGEGSFGLTMAMMRMGAMLDRIESAYARGEASEDEYADARAVALLMGELLRMRERYGMLEASRTP